MMNRKQRRELQKNKVFKRIRKKSTDEAYRTLFNALRNRWEKDQTNNDGDVVDYQDDEMDLND